MQAEKHSWVFLSWVEKPGRWAHAGGSQHALRPGTLSLSSACAPPSSSSLDLCKVRAFSVVRLSFLSLLSPLSPSHLAPLEQETEETALGLVHRSILGSNQLGRERLDQRGP